MMLSRRQFLRRTGGFAALMATAAPSRPPEEIPVMATLFGTSLGLSETLSPVGRAFNVTTVYPKPDVHTRPISQLLPDSLNPLLGVSPDGWYYRIKEGYVPRESLQPILPYERPTHDPKHFKGFHETVAPFTAVRQYCAGHAPIVGRVGYGAVLYVHDHLTDDKRQTWYAVSVGHTGAGLFGWVPALHMRRWVPPQTALSAPALWIDNARCKMSVYDGETLIGETAIYGTELPRGLGHVKVNLPAAWASFPPAFIRSWILLYYPQDRKPMSMYGAFWHNRFGTPSKQASIEMPMHAARWLYNMLGGVNQAEIPLVVD